MKKWDPSYTRAIVSVLVIALFLSGVCWLENREYKFEGSDQYVEKLESWMPGTSVEGTKHSISGELLYYTIDCYEHPLLLNYYVGVQKASRRISRGNIKSESDIGAIAVLYYDEETTAGYRNGAAANTVCCTVFILDKDTLEVLARDTVYGGSPPATTSGGDRRGSFPSKNKIYMLAENLMAELNRQYGEKQEGELPRSQRILWITACRNIDRVNPIFFP